MSPGRLVLPDLAAKLEQQIAASTAADVAVKVRFITYDHGARQPANVQVTSPAIVAG